MDRNALIVGASGIIGNNLARHLLAGGWTVHGLARRPPVDIPGLRPIAADLLQPDSLRQALAGLQPTHVFLTTWMRQASEADNCAVNGALVRNLLGALADRPSLRHVALVTGLKHYLGPFEAYGKGHLPETPFREEQPRLPVENFYYVQEDELFAAAGRQGFAWSVHRPHSVIGYAIGNAMNMGVTLATYASLCREAGRPFLFPGSPTQWHGLTDVTDARQLARQLEWAATSDAARNQAFNIVDGDVFRWKWMWSQIAGWFDLAAAPYPGHPTPLVEQMKHDAPLWRRIAERDGLAEPDLDRLASAWHTDADLGRDIECVTDMSKSRKAGFVAYQDSRDAFFDLFARLRQEKIIP
ncbi:SDR family oxidoreductase [Nannocystis radixulma]|uniref:SDR family oxidoreductase n=1 Tax=Nannocystis radixulma TaxID=2995305 RepID=A0ABT5B0X1_9BACT|nr:SDR family oxidoreductase [Nannocystis radixulma]MDC0667749.1 SDR family oxidoreductase [Nannocystis radixulma]